MTTETLLKAKEIDSELKHLRRVKKALNSPYENRFKCVDYDGHRETSESLVVDDELKEIIEKYLSQKIDELEKEFGEL